MIAPAAILVLLAVLGLAPSGTAKDAAKPAAAPPASTDKTPPPAKYAGADTCIACHSDVAEAQAKDWHSSHIAHMPGTKNCEECHGPSAAHADDPSNVRTYTDVKNARADKAAAACLGCHAAQHRAMDWKLSDHARAGVKCWTCHSAGGTAHTLTVRHPDRNVCYSCHRDQQATFELTTHHPVREGRLDCSDCHDAHARRANGEVNRLCASCHAEQRGPFVFAHGSLTSGLMEGCLDCHRPHGSPNERLLKYAGRGLCLQCHADHAMHFVGRTCWTSGCHSQPHGSNINPLLLGR